MDSNQSGDRSPRDSEGGTPPRKSPKHGLSPPNKSKTMREIHSEVQELKRENFNLKLRIYFLEEQNEMSTGNRSSSLDRQYRHSSQYGTGNRTVDIVRSSTSSHGLSTNTESEELRILKAELQRCRQENEQLRRTIDATTSLHTSVVQYGESDNKLHHKYDSLKKEITKLNEDLYELRQSNERYRTDIRNYEEEKIKADRTLRRVQTDYDAQIANVQGGSQTSTNYESYRHEPLLARIRVSYPVQHQVSSDVNIDTYLEKIAHQEHIITQLMYELNEMKARPAITKIVPTDPQLSYEYERRLNVANQQIRDYEQRISGFDHQASQKLSLKIKELEHDIESLTQQIQGRENRLRELTVENEQMRMQKSSEYTRIELRYTEEIQTLQKQIESRDRRLQELDMENERLRLRKVPDYSEIEVRYTEEIQTLRHQIESRDSRLRELADQNDQLRLQKSSEYTRIELRYTEEIQTLKTQIESRNHRLEELVNENQQLRLRKQPDYSEIEVRYTEEVQTLRRQIESRDRRLDELVQQNDQLRSQKSGEYTKIELRYTEEIQTLSKQIQSRDRRLEELANENERLRLRKVPDYSEIEVRYTEEVQTLRKQIEARDSRVRELADQNEQLRLQKSSEYTRTELRLTEEIQTLSKQIHSRDHRLEELVEENERLRLRKVPDYSEIEVRYTEEIQTLRRQIENRERRLDELAVQNEQLRLQKSGEYTKIELRYTEELQTLTKQIQSRDRRLEELVDENERLRLRKVPDYSEIEIRYTEELQTLKQQIESRDRRLHELTNQNEQLRLQTSSEYTRIELRYTEELQTLKKQIQSRERRVEELVEENERLRTRKVPDYSEIEIRYTEEIQTLRKHIESRDRRLEELADQNKQLTLQKSSEYTRIELRFTEEIQTLTKQIQSRDRRLEELADENERLRLRKIPDCSEIELRYTDEIRILRKQIESRDHRLDELSDENERLRLRKVPDYSEIEIRYTEEIQTLRRQMENRDRRLEELTNENERLRLRKIPDNSEIEVRYTEEIRILQRTIRELETQLEHERRVDDRYVILQRQLNEKQQQYEDLRVKYTKFTFDSRNIEEFATTIRKQEEELEEYRLKFQRIQYSFQEERSQLEREIALEKERVKQVQDHEIRRYNELRTDYDRLQINFNEQKNRYEQQIHTYQVQITRFEETKGTTYETLTQLNDDFRRQIADYEVRIQNWETTSRRSKIDYETVHENYQRVQQQLHDYVDEITQWKRKYDQIQIDLTVAEQRLDQTKVDNHTLHIENTKLTHQVDALRANINIDIKEKYESEYRIRYNEMIARKDEEILNIQRDKETAESNYQRCNKERIHFEQRFHTVESELQTVNQTIENYRRDIDRLKEELQSKNNHVVRYEPVRVVQSVDTTHYSQLIAELREQIRRQDDLIRVRQADHYVTQGEPEHVQLEFRIRVDQLEQVLQTQQHFSHQHNTNVQTDNHRFETLQTELQSCEKRLSSIITEHNFAIQQHLQNIKQLQLNIVTREEELSRTSIKLRKAEQTITEQQHEIADHARQHSRLTIDLNIAREDKDILLDKIKDFENRINIRPIMNISTEHIDQYKHEITILRDQLQQREVSIQNYKEAQLRHDQMKKQLTSDMEDLNQTVTSLRQKLSGKDDEIHNVTESYTTLKRRFDGLNMDDKSSIVASLRSDIQERDREIAELKQKLKIQISNQHTSTVIYETTPRLRPDFDHSKHEELSFKLERALQRNQDLSDQLKKNSPNLTEIHSQLVEVRQELSRQKYVNQVLWRKLNALIDIHGSNTRTELAHELANYQDELAKLKLQQNRTNAARSVIINANARSSSEQNLSVLHQNLSSMGIELPSKNIKSTIALLERSSIEWQTKLARLTEQLGRSESQSRNHQRELVKCQKLLYDAGLFESPIRQRRHSADDLVIIGLNQSNINKDDLTTMKNLDELKEIIRNQRKHIQQLQMRVRTNTPDLLQSPTTEKHNEQIQNLNLVIDTYKNESNLLKTELQKVYKTIEHNQKLIPQYEKRLKDQQTSLEQLRKLLQKYEHLIQKHDLHIPIFDERKDHILDSFDDYIIDLDIDIIQANDKKKISSSIKKDITNVPTYTYEDRQQILKKDNEIQRLNTELINKDDQIEQLKIQFASSKRNYENNSEYDRIRRDAADDLRSAQLELRETRLQLDSLKTENIRLSRLEQQNQKSRAEIEHLENEIERYKTRIELLEGKLSRNITNTTEVVIQKSELTALLEEIRLLRHELEESTERQRQLQLKLEENIRQSQSPREFTFSGRGVSNSSGLRIIDASGITGTENLSSSTVIEKHRSRPAGSSATEFEHTEHFQERANKLYVVGNVKAHQDLHQLMEDIKCDLKTVLPAFKNTIQLTTNVAATDASGRSFDERLNSLETRLTQALQLIETYWKAKLPEKDPYNVYQVDDYRLIEENKKLLLAQRKYIQDIQQLKEKYKQQSTQLDQLLTQLTKANQKKTDTGEYMALLLQPTIDILQKARSNIENHLKESNSNNMPPGSAQSHHRHRRRRSRPNHHD